MEININDLDWKALLIKRYKNYDLNEMDCMVLFVSDAVLHVQEKTLITKEVLSPYMADCDGIDTSLSSLLSKKILTIKNEGTSFYSSLEDFKKKLFDDAMKDIVLKSQNSNYNVMRSDSLYQEIESIVNRTLTQLERDQVTSWLKQGAQPMMIKEALQKSLTRSGNLSFKNADKLILEMERSQSRQTTGSSLVNEETRKREELRDLFSRNDWTYHGDK